MKQFIASILPFGLVNWYLKKKKLSYIDKMVSERKKKLTSLNEQRNTVQSNGKYVNFGCGKNYQNGWINIDAEDNGDINLFFSTDNVIPFDSNSIDGVFSEHFIEHIDFLTGVHFMSESYRILKPKGVLRIICPDLDYVLNGLNDLKLNKLKGNVYLGWGFP